MKLRTAIPMVFFLLPAAAALADSDLCLFGKDRDVRTWLKDGKDFKAIACKKNGPTAKTLQALKKSLLHDGYHIVNGPTIHTIPLGPNPAPELLAEIKALHCAGRPHQIYTVCVTIKEDEPRDLAPAKSLPDQEPPSAQTNVPALLRPKPRPTAGKMRAE